MTKEMVLFESGDGKVSLPVPMDSNTVWLSQAQMALLFGKDVSVVNRHIKNAISEGEIEFFFTICKKCKLWRKDLWIEEYCHI